MADRETSHENVELVRRWFEEVWNQRRAETIDELLIAESVCHGDDGPLRGPQEFKERQFVPFTSAFSDLRVTIEGVIAQGDNVVVRWVATGKHSGDGLGFPATHESVAMRGITWIRVRAGKLVEGWQSTNIPEVLRNLQAAAGARRGGAAGGRE
jgi:steroid delta-isomerase-like uncharacterized protein